MSWENILYNKKEQRMTLANKPVDNKTIDKVLVDKIKGRKGLEKVEKEKDYSKLQSLIKPTEESKLLAAAQKERNIENELEKVVAKKKLGKVGKKEGSKVDWADAGQKVAAGLISAAQEREKARIAQDTINRGLLRDQLELSNAASARRGQALSGLRTALANYFR